LDPGRLTTLVPIRPEQFSAFAEAANSGYAQDNVVSGRWPSAEASTLAKAEFEQLLPQGPATPNHYVYEIQDETAGETVGFLWFAVVGAGDARSAFIYNVTVKQSFRRRGHAKAALAWLEQFANAQGLASIRLNVFAHNPQAQALYRALGYKTTSMNMRKVVRANGA
jgi:ribosomal protein S18 acetylase RimI-like enzyme